MMDFRGASWVGDIYQKFEAMCMEVEETICEDAVKFVESQVHNVGSNMKKFYSDVMQDLASPDSTAPVKLPIDDSPLDSHADSKINENKKTINKEDTNKVVNLFANDLKVIDREDREQVSSLDEHVKQGMNSCSKGSIKGSFSMQDTNGEQYEDTTVCCKKVPKKDCCRKTTSKNQVSENQDEASLVSEIIFIHEHATIEHIVLASPQASVEVVGWEWDSREEEKEMGSCEGIEVDDFKQGMNSCSRGSIKGSFSMQDTNGEQYEDTTVCCKKVPKKDCCRKTTSKNQVLENQDEASLVSEIKFMHEHATIEHMVLASPQASVEVVGWEWDSREEEKEMGSCEGIEVDDFTVRGPLSTDVLSLRTVGEGLAQDFIEMDSPVKLNALGDSKTFQTTGELVVMSDSGKKDAGNEDVTENNDSMDLKVDTTDEDEIKLEETCVFVNDKNVSFASYKDKQPWSYKKKMKEAFSLKKKSSRRQEYKKLVTQYENANTSSSLTCVDTVTHTVSPESNTAELQTREFCESDWELL